MEDRRPKALEIGNPLARTSASQKVSPAGRELTRLESVILDLYVRGLARRKIARLLIEHLAPAANGESLNARLQLATKRLRNLEGRRWFRDLLWERAMIATDMASPRIMAGITQKATEGRVDAAKLALSITGRYTEQGDVQATQVNIVFGADIPRPSRHGIASQKVAEDEPIIEGEWTES